MKKNRQKVVVRTSRLRERDLATVRGGAIVGGGRAPSDNGTIIIYENGTIIID